MRMLALTAVVLGLVGATTARADDGLRVEHAAARMIVIPEARSNMSVTVQQGDPRLPRLDVRQDGAGVIVEGGLDRRIQGCRGGLTTTHIFGLTTRTGDSRAVQIEGVGRVPLSQLPVITAHVPLHAKIAVGEAVWGEVGPSAGLDFANIGCGDWTLGDVRGPLSISETGSGDVRGRSAQGAHVRLSGSGDVGLSEIEGDADVSVAGSGDVRLGGVNGAIHAQTAGSGGVSAASVNGPIRARMASSGDVIIANGRAPHVEVSLAGSGDFAFRGTAGALEASVVGSGDVTVAHVAGPVSKSVIGSGEVNAGR